MVAHFAAPRRELAERPRLKRQLTVIPMADGRLQLRAGDERIVVLEGALASEALPVLLEAMDGEATVDHIVGALAGKMDEEDVRGVLALLAQEGLLENGPSWPDTLSPEEEQYRYLSGFDIDPLAARRCLQACRCVITGGAALARAVATSLEAHGLEQVEVVDARAVAECGLSEETGLVVFAEEKAETPTLRRVNAQCLRLGLPWLYVACSPGHHGIVGPLFVPPDTCCYECFASRLAANTVSPEEFDARERHVAAGRDVRPFGSLAAHRSLLAAMTSVEVLKHLLGFQASSILNRSTTIDLLTFETWSEPVLRFPGCAACGTPIRARSPWTT